jgi:uncharacterized protein (DUF342 family)
MKNPILSQTQNFHSINSAKESLSPSKLAELTNNESICESELSEITDSIRAFVRVLYAILEKKETLSIDNQSVVYLKEIRKAA